MAEKNSSFKIPKSSEAVEEMGVSAEESQSRADSVNEGEAQQAREYLFSLGINPDERELTPAQAVRKAQQLQEVGLKAAQVLSRGQTLDGIEKMLSRLPSDRVGQLVRDNDLDIERYKSLGYRIETRESGESTGAHDPADGRIRLGDCILMSVDRDIYNVIERGRQQARKPKVDVGRNKFHVENRGHGVPVIDTTKGGAQ